MRVLLDTPAITPSCFGEPDRCKECRGCGLRQSCYEKQIETVGVFLLPVDRPVQHVATWGSPFVRAWEDKEPG